MTTIMFDNPEFFTIDKERALYHGTLTGLKGKISVNCQEAGERREFGLGFYTATTEEPVQRIISPYSYDNLPNDYVDPFIYKIRADLTGLKGVRLSGFAWIMYITYNWGYLTRDFCPDFCDSIEDFTNNISIVTGPISDDKLFTALDDFVNENISFEGLNVCVRISDSGEQYVFKDQKEVDDRLKIFRTIRPSISQCKAWAERESARRDEWQPRYNRFRKKSRKKGMMFSEIVDEIKSKQILFAEPQRNASLLKLVP